MNELEKLYDRIIQRLNINLRELNFDAEPYSSGLIVPEQMNKFYAFYGISTDHPLSLEIRHSGLAGSYFLGKCRVSNSLLYKTDIRGDELKRKGSMFACQGFDITITQDECVNIAHSALVKTLVHNFSHDPETPEEFFIRDTLAMDYANIHGAPTEGAFLGPFATVDLTTVRDCVIGTYSYIQAGEISHMTIPPGTVWVNSPGNFNFYYSYDQALLSSYASVIPGDLPHGYIIDFIGKHEAAFQRVFDTVNLEAIESIPKTASLDRYAVVLPKTKIADNVLVSQRAYLSNSSLGKGSNAQENCYIINSNLAGFNVTAHGAKIIESELERDIFVGFNSFLFGKPESRIKIGKGCIVMPHTIIDINSPLQIPEEHLVWGLIRNEQDLKENSISIAELQERKSGFSKGRLNFEGDGGLFVKAFKDRIHHILDVNGAFFDGEKNMGHAQRNQNLSLNTIQPFQFGEMEGLYPNITIGL
ncbi:MULTISPECIES: transferase [Desulfosediminicola]|uniref:transferase n=1 Tax=Desulfosediminicola TaxID=2886823 RepID=UPI0010AD7449|nr:transferase [Desulfosediminicola ganghwensis]